MTVPGIRELCQVCGSRIRMMCQLRTGVCSQLCRDKRDRKPTTQEEQK